MKTRIQLLPGLGADASLYSLALSHGSPCAAWLKAKLDLNDRLASR